MQVPDQIQEDILIIGGGPIGGFMAHIFATKFKYSVRVIERLPNLLDPNVKYTDRSGGIGMSYRANKVYYKYGLKEQYEQICIPVDHAQIMIQDFKMDVELIPGKKVFYYPVGRRDLTEMLNKQNQSNSKIHYEYDTRVENIDFENNTIETMDKKTGQSQIRRFSFIIGADGYRSMVRQSMEKKIVQDRKLPQNTQLTRIEENLLSTWNFFVPNKSQYQILQEEVKQGKYPWYEKLDDKFKNGHVSEHGEFILDPTSLILYGQQNLLALTGPMTDRQFNICIGIPAEKNSLEQFLENHQEFKGSWRIDPSFNTNVEQIQTEEQAHQFFAQHFPIFYGMTPDLVDQWKNNKIYKNYTVYCDNWHYNSQACLFGDACEGITFISGNGLNAAMENVDQFFQILEEKTLNNYNNFLRDSSIREEIFKQYQNHCFEYTRALQESDILDVVFPGIAQAQHPKGMLFNMVEGIIMKQAEGIYLSKLNLQFYSKDSFKVIIQKSKLFKDYILGKIKDAEKIEDVDLSECKKELIDILKRNNLPVNYEFDDSVFIKEVEQQN